MIFRTFNRRRAVLEYNTTTKLPRATINMLLKQAWDVTPSKNNFMPYTVHVLGPRHQHYKNLVYQNCLNNEGRNDGSNPAIKYSQRKPFYANILNCSYLLIFTLRLEDQPTPYQIDAMRRGHKFEYTREETLEAGYAGACLEVGMFSDVFGGLCQEKEIDVSSVLCFTKNLNTWADLPFVTRKPILLMTVGKAKVYKGVNSSNLRPNYERIVNFVDARTTTPTNATYVPNTGLLTFTVANHGLSDGSKISISPNSITFRCALDNNATTHTYPRISDPACYTPLPIISTGVDTLTVNIGISPNTSDHTFVSARADAISY
jgi:hypothetical protein